jgi:calcineurin-like phosphoesterase family protein
MKDIWVISDTHFGHQNIIRYCNRPFADEKEMNEAMIERWNSVVKPGDIVYHLGDVYFGEQGKVLHKLVGRKRLILGNHDLGKDPYIQNNFQKILMWRMFPEFGLLLTHVPVHPNSLFKVSKNVHGHIHDKNMDDERYINVSVEQIDYTPVHIETLRVT